MSLRRTGKEPKGFPCSVSWPSPYPEIKYPRAVPYLLALAHRGWGGDVMGEGKEVNAQHLIEIQQNVADQCPACCLNGINIFQAAVPVDPLPA
ncbi:MAG: hypothetical protein U0936_02695 [Planctomycetaceae bacterium]